MAEFVAQVFEPALGLRRLRVQAEHAGAVAAALGVPASAVVAVTAVDPVLVSAAGRGTLDLRLFSQELALLLQSGIPLLEALETLREKDGGRAGRASRATLDTVIDALRQGLPISEALARAHPHRSTRSSSPSSLPANAAASSCARCRTTPRT